MGCLNEKKPQILIADQKEGIDWTKKIPLLAKKSSEKVARKTDNLQNVFFFWNKKFAISKRNVLHFLWPFHFINKNRVL